MSQGKTVDEQREFESFIETIAANIDTIDISIGPMSAAPENRFIEGGSKIEERGEPSGDEGEGNNEDCLAPKSHSQQNVRNFKKK